MMGRKLANVVSAVMHPLLMPSWLFALLFYYVPTITEPVSRKAAPYILLAVFITTFVLPMVSIIALRLSVLMTGNKLAALAMPDRRERVVPFFFVSMFYVITTYMFFAKLRVSQALVLMLLAATVILVLITLITLFFKISVYSSSAGSLFGCLIGLSVKMPQLNTLLMPILLVLILGGAAMSARLYLNLHKPSEILAGYLLGSSVSVGIMVLFLTP